MFVICVRLMARRSSADCSAQATVSQAYPSAARAVHRMSVARQFYIAYCPVFCFLFVHAPLPLSASASAACGCPHLNLSAVSQSGYGMLLWTSVGPSIHVPAPCPPCCGTWLVPLWSACPSNFPFWCHLLGSVLSCVCLAGALRADGKSALATGAWAHFPGSIRGPFVVAS